MNAPLYTTDILRLAASLPEPRELEREDGRAELRSPTCGSRIATAVQFDERGRIVALSQRVHACAFGQASAALVQAGAPRRSADELRAALDELQGWLAGSADTPSWPGIAALEAARPRKGRHGAILLPFRAVVAAVEASG